MMPVDMNWVNGSVGQVLYLCSGFTGIDQQYEEPLKPEVVLRAGELSVDECVKQLITYLHHRVCTLC